MVWGGSGRHDMGHQDGLVQKGQKGMVQVAQEGMVEGVRMAQYSEARRAQDMGLKTA